MIAIDENGKQIPNEEIINSRTNSTQRENSISESSPTNNPIPWTETKINIPISNKFGILNNIIFADDTALLSYSRHRNTSVQNLQNAVDGLSQWLLEWKIAINSKITRFTWVISAYSLKENNNK
ncbi:hypothetical protein JTB14_002434 [Gonioctena quinquepunctata]|nr:hypothetical protein JTB14_002434 [Gonioctena quinquepunctata]